MRDEPLDEAEVDKALQSLPAWNRSGDNTLTAGFRGDRSRAAELYARIAGLEDRADHHATVSITYSTFSFTLTTHDSGNRITRRDTELAQELTGVCAEYGYAPVQ